MANNDNEIPGVSIVTCTHVPYFMDNIFDNYSRQAYSNKELILILNNMALNMDTWYKKAENYPNVHIYMLHEDIPVGTCMNFAVERTKYEFVANFDHDDYYGQGYIDDFMEVVPHVDAGIFGKKTHYVYLEGDKTMAVLHPDKENCYVEYIDGCTLFMRKSIFEKVKFIGADISDWQLSWHASQQGIKIYSVNRYNFAYLRRTDTSTHTWKMENDEILRLHCKVIGKVDDYETFVNNR